MSNYLHFKDIIIQNHVAVTATFSLNSSTQMSLSTEYLIILPTLIWKSVFISIISEFTWTFWIALLFKTSVLSNPGVFTHTGECTSIVPALGLGVLLTLVHTVTCIVEKFKNCKRSGYQSLLEGLKNKFVHLAQAGKKYVNTRFTAWIFLNKSKFDVQNRLIWSNIPIVRHFCSRLRNMVPE